MNKPCYQKFVQITFKLFIGFTALGGLLDAISNAISMINIQIATAITITGSLAFICLEFYLKKNPLDWVVKSGQTIQIKEISRKMKLQTLGATILLWVPVVVGSFSSHNIKGQDSITQDIAEKKVCKLEYDFEYFYIISQKVILTNNSNEIIFFKQPLSKDINLFGLNNEGQDIYYLEGYNLTNYSDTNIDLQLSDSCRLINIMSEKKKVSNELIKKCESNHGGSIWDSGKIFIKPKEKKEYIFTIAVNPWIKNNNVNRVRYFRIEFPISTNFDQYMFKNTYFLEGGESNSD